MPKKIFDLEDIGEINVYKHASARNIKLRVNSDGVIRVTIPRWAPYKAGYIFAQSKVSWIQKQLPQKLYLTHDSFIGKQHRVVIQYDNKVKKPIYKVHENQIKMRAPLGVDVLSDEIQAGLIKSAEKALKAEASEYLPSRLRELSMSHNFTYKNVSVKKMKSRWGSCTSHKDISLNIFLMQLEDDLIDYVLLHELLHTEIQAHGKRFWSALEQYIPELNTVRKQMRSVEPKLFPR